MKPETLKERVFDVIDAYSQNGGATNWLISTQVHAPEASVRRATKELAVDGRIYADGYRFRAVVWTTSEPADQTFA